MAGEQTPHANCTMEQIRADTLKIPDYQRQRIDWAFCKRIAREFDPDLYYPLEIARRADGDYVLDGQHRLLAVRDVLNWGDQKVDCRVWHELNVDREVKKFTAQTGKTRKALSPLDTLHADWVAGKPSAVALVRCVEQAGLRFAWDCQMTPGTVRCAKALITQYRALGDDLLIDALKLTTLTFGDDARSYQQQIVVGVGQFLLRYREHENYDRKYFAQKIGRFGVDLVLARAQIIAAGRGQSAGGRASAGRALVALYNHQRLHENRLPEWEEGVIRPETEEGRRQAASEYAKTYGWDRKKRGEEGKA